MPLIPSPTNSKHYDVIALATSMVGVIETPKASNRGTEVDKFTGGRAEPWCAHFVAWLFRTCGKPLPKDVVPSPKVANPLASVNYLEGQLQSKGWLIYSPVPGDLVFYASRGKSDPGKGRHIGLVVAVFDDRIETIEGNWGDGVVRRSVKLNDPQIVSFGRIP